MWKFRSTQRADALMRLIPLAAACCAAGCVAPNLPPARALSRPVPAAVIKEATWIAPDGEEFYYSAWVPAENPPASVIVAVHGLGGAASDFRPLGEHLSRRGIAVYAPELRGMGNDPRKDRRGTIHSRCEWLTDFAAFSRAVESRWPEGGVVWYGESLGSVILLQSTLWREQQELHPDAVVLAAPILETSGKLPAWKAAVVRGLTLTTPWLRIRLSVLDPETASDARVVAVTTHERQKGKTPHALDTFSMRLLGEIGQLVSENQEASHELDLPLLVLHGGHDLFTPPEEVTRFVESALPHAPQPERRLFSDSFHLLLHDVERDQVLQTIEAWLATRVEP